MSNRRDGPRHRGQRAVAVAVAAAAAAAVAAVLRFEHAVVAAAAAVQKPRLLRKLVLVQRASVCYRRSEEQRFGHWLRVAANNTANARWA